MAKVENGVLLEVDESDVERLNNGESWEAVFGLGITEIGELAFFMRRDLKKLPDFPEGLTKIGARAFWGCSNLSRLPHFPIGLKEIGESAFRSCSDLKTLPIFPESLLVVKKGAFYGCKNLTSLVIPKHNITFEQDAFGSCVLISSLTLLGRKTVDTRWLQSIGIDLYNMSCEETKDGIVFSSKTIKTVKDYKAMAKGTLAKAKGLVAKLSVRGKDRSLVAKLSVKCKDLLTKLSGKGKE